MMLHMPIGLVAGLQTVPIKDRRRYLFTDRMANRVDSSDSCSSGRTLISAVI